MWSANCGASFGHELMFSMTLEKAKNGVGRNFETVKIAHGRSRMFEDWYPNNGRYWDALNRSIWSRAGAGNHWGGFMWHQGEQGEKMIRLSRQPKFLSDLCLIHNSINQSHSMSVILVLRILEI
jgi:hypothetical protein